MSGFGLRSIAISTALFVSCIAIADTNEPGNKASPTYQYGDLIGRLIQAGHFLEILTTGECKQFARSPHYVTSDTREIARNIPSTLLPPNVSFEVAARKSILTRREYAQREIAELTEVLDVNKTAPELRCGILLGIASAAYYQARYSWAEYHRLEKPVWQQP